MTQAQPEQSPEDRARLQAAALDERDAMVGFLQNRVVVLNAEVRRRDEALAALENEVAELRVLTTVQERLAEPAPEAPESPDLET